MSTPMSVLVTGGAGYIGSILTEKLLAQNYRVLVLDNFIYTEMGIQHLYRNPNLSVIRGDICNREDLQSALQNVKYVIHLAAIANDPSGELNPELTRSVNHHAYPLLLETSRKAGVRRFINASTFSVYGIKHEPNITEDMSLTPLKEYSICKAESEKIVRDFNSSEFITTSLRCATVCGWSRRMRFDLIVNTLTYHAILYGKIKVWGGEQLRPQIHIQDLTDYFIELLDTPPNLISGEIFNAGGQNVSIIEIAQEIQAVLGSQIDIELEAPRADERSYHVSSEKIARVLGLRPKRTIRDAVREIIEAYDQGLWRNPLDSIYHNIERMKSLSID